MPTRRSVIFVCQCPKSVSNPNQVVYESYWSPSQVKARSHQNMLATQSYMNQFYTADPDQKS